MLLTGLEDVIIDNYPILAYDFTLLVIKQSKTILLHSAAIFRQTNQSC